MLDLTLPTDQAESRWEWPASSRVPEPVRRQIEAEHSQPQLKRADEVARLHAENVELRKRLDRLERALAVETKQRKALGAGIVPAICAIGAAVTDLEKRPSYKFLGTFVEGSEYEPGNIVVRSGSSWICTEKTKDGIPGKSPCWAQLSRAGRDGRDARDLMRQDR